MAELWCPFATRTRAGRFADAPFNSTSNPKLLWHTTEGASCSGAIRTYNTNGYAPHFTIDPYSGEVHQHYPINSRSTTLADGTHSVNRQATIQVEVVGTCDRSASWAGPSSKWYVGNWTDSAYKTLAKLALWVEEQFHVPRRSAATFRAYPDSYGFNAAQRLSWTQYVAANGHVGHQHAPYNSHGDPGVMSFTKLFAAMSELEAPSPVIIAPRPATTKEDVPMRRNPFTMDTRTTQPLTAGQWTLIRMSDDWVSLNTTTSPVLFSYDCWLQLTGTKAGQQIQVRTYTAKTVGRHAVTAPSDQRSGVSPIREFVATAGDTFISWSQVAQELGDGEYLRVEVNTLGSGASVVRAQSKAIYWKESD